MRREIRRARRTSRKRDEERGRDDEPGLGFEVYGLVRTRTSFRTRDKGREFSSSRERSELSFFLGSYGPRSGTGATQSYWRHEVVLAAEGDWRISSSRERSELSFFLGSYGPRSGNGTMQSYWHREAILACASRLAKRSSRSCQTLNPKLHARSCVLRHPPITNHQTPLF